MPAGKVEFIELGCIDRDRLTDFSLGSLPEALWVSMRQIGITHPVTLLREGDRFGIVCGHRRVGIAQEVELETVPAWVWNGELSDADRLFWNLKENLGHRSWSDAEKGLILGRLQQAGVSVEDCVQDALPLLGLEKSKKLAEDFLSAQAFQPGQLTLLHSLNVPLRVFKTMFRWSDEDRALVFDLFAKLQPGVNKWREVLEKVDEIAVRDNVSPRHVLGEPEIQSVLNNADLSAHEQYDAIHKQLHARRNPHLSELQRSVGLAIDKLQLDGRVKLKAPENFENDLLRVEMKFDTVDEFTRQVEQLFKACDSEALAELIRIFKEMK